MKEIDKDFRELELLFFKGKLKESVFFIRDFLNKISTKKYGDLFENHYNIMVALHNSFNPEKYIDFLALMEISLKMVLKKAYRERDIYNARVIKELITILKDFQTGEEDDIF